MIQRVFDHFSYKTEAEKFWNLIKLDDTDDHSKHQAYLQTKCISENEKNLETTVIMKF